MTAHVLGLVQVQHYVIKFVSDLRQVGGFLRVLRLPPPIKLTATISEVNCGTREEKAVPATYKTPAVLLINFI
jgi:hypothetical protein